MMRQRKAERGGGAPQHPEAPAPGSSKRGSQDESSAVDVATAGAAGKGSRLGGQLARRVLYAFAVGLALVAATLYSRYGQAGAGAPTLGVDAGEPSHAVGGDDAQVVAELDSPPGNLAVSPRSGRILFNFHPEYARADGVVFAEIDATTPDGWIPRRDLGERVASVLSLRIDSLDRLWLLDFGMHGMFPPGLAVYQLGSSAKDDRFLFRYDFPSSVAGFGSMLNDMAISSDAEHIYIADTSFIANSPALVYYHSATNQSWRVLEGHRAVQFEPLDMHVHGAGSLGLGVLSMRIGVDSIALDAKDEWLYFGPLTGTKLYRVPARLLQHASHVDGAVEVFSDKCVSDGIALSASGDVFLTCLEHSAIARVDAKTRALTVVARDRAKLQWPDGFSWDGEGRLLVTTSALQYKFTMQPYRPHAPFHIIRFSAL